MEEIVLISMTKELARQFYSEFTLDPDLFLDKSSYKPFVYSQKFSDARVERYAAMGRVFLAVMLNGKPIGEIVLKEIDHTKRCCTLGISMINDSYKNKGYGTEAERLALEYAFRKMEMKTVYADTIITNLRSQHVLKKAGFRETYRDGDFVYFRCDVTNLTEHTA